MRKNKEKKNMEVRDELEVELNDLIKSEPLFSRVEIMRVKDYKIDDKETGKQYSAEIEIIGFFDLIGNNVPIKEKVKILSKREITKNEIIPQPKVEVKVLEDYKINYEEKVESKKICIII